MNCPTAATTTSLRARQRLYARGIPINNLLYLTVLYSISRIRKVLGSKGLKVWLWVTKIFAGKFGEDGVDKKTTRSIVVNNPPPPFPSRLESGASASFPLHSCHIRQREGKEGGGADDRSTQPRILNQLKFGFFIFYFSHFSKFIQHYS